MLASFLAQLQNPEKGTGCFVYNCPTWFFHLPFHSLGCLVTTLLGWTTVERKREVRRDHCHQPFGCDRWLHALHAYSQWMCWFSWETISLLRIPLLKMPSCIISYYCLSLYWVHLYFRYLLGCGPFWDDYSHHSCSPEKQSNRDLDPSEVSKCRHLLTQAFLGFFLAATDCFLCPSSFILWGVNQILHVCKLQRALAKLSKYFSWSLTWIKGGWSTHPVGVGWTVHLLLMLSRRHSFPISQF